MDSTKLSAPAAIIIAGLIVGGAVLYNGRAAGNQQANTNPPAAEASFKPDAIRPFAETDHLRGNPEAPVVILEYSDLECPFCKLFHQTMEEVVKEYDGKVAWVYRHFPLPIHAKAEKEAEATECVAKLGGETKFWDYADKIFSVTPSNNGLDLALLPKMAVELGVDQKQFEECLQSGEMAGKIKADLDNAVAAGGQGTPFSIIITKDGAKELGGAVPAAQLKTLIDQALKS